MFELPETRYAKSGDVNIAYQLVGDGPFDLIHVPPFVSNLELQWEDPAERRYFERLAMYQRVQCVENSEFIVGTCRRARARRIESGGEY